MDDLERTANRIAYVWPQAERADTDQDLYLESVALNLHGFYSGLKKLFELIATYIDQKPPQGQAWHRDLLRWVSQPTDTRPAVIQATYLDELRRFRHVVRNVYTANLKADRMKAIALAVPELWLNLKADLLSLAEFLERIVDSAE